MQRFDLRYLGAAIFMAAIALSSCGGGGYSSGTSSNPSGVIPTPTPTRSPTPTPLPSGVTPTPVPTATPVTATIAFSGSVNSSWFQIVLQTNGTAMVTGPATGTPMPGMVPHAVTSQFFTDLNLSGGVKNLPIGTCPTPTNTAFNDTTTVTYLGQTSGNVACPASGSRTVQVYNDVKAVEQALGITPPSS
jgi:hypothetical protein